FARAEPAAARALHARPPARWVQLLWAPLPPLPKPKPHSKPKEKTSERSQRATSRRPVGARRTGRRETGGRGTGRGEARRGDAGRGRSRPGAAVGGALTGSLRSVVLAGGGTGGHVFPLLAFADCLRRHDPHIRITCLGTPRGLENELIPPRGYELRHVPAYELPRAINLNLVRTPDRMW